MQRAYVYPYTYSVTRCGDGVGTATLSCAVPLQRSVLGSKMFIAYTLKTLTTSLHAMHFNITGMLTIRLCSASTMCSPSHRDCSIVSLMLPAGVGLDNCNCRAKKELVWFGSSSSLRSLSQSNRTVVVGTDVLQPVESVRNLWRLL